MAPQIYYRPAKLLIFSIFVLLSALSWVPCECAEGSHFCYDDNDPDCTGPSSWGGFCNDPNSRRQSPIQLPKTYSSSLALRAITLNLKNYKSESFSLRNNGDTVVIRFPKQSNSLDQVALTRLEGVGLLPKKSDYILDSAHFHWGSENSKGSEHCLEDGGCFGMELHLVHYRNTFDSVASALNTTEPDTLAVIGVMLQVTQGTDDSNSELTQVYNNLEGVNKEFSEVNVNRTLNFGSILSQLPKQGKVYTYKGSLTTPNCNQKVNWFVLAKPVAISSDTVAKFRKLNGFDGEAIQENHRPLQPRNSRGVYYAAVRTK